MIQVSEARRNSDDGAAPFMELVQFIHVLGEDITQQRKVTARMALADMEDQLLSFIQGDIRVLLLIGNSGNFARSFDEAAQNGIALDDAPVILNVAAGRHLVDQGGNVAGSSDILQFVPTFQLVTDRDEICWFALLIELKNDLVNSAVGVTIEIVGEQKFCHLDNCLWVDNDAAEYAALRLNVLR